MEDHRLDETTLVDQALAGNIRAYEELVRTYQDLAFRVAFLVVRDASEAEDVTQESFIKAYRALPRFRSGWPFRPWLLKIVANEAHNRRVSLGRQARLAIRLEAEGTRSDVALSPETVVIAGERRALLLAAVNRLCAQDQLVIGYRYFLELSEAEMATMMGCAKGTVKSRLSRALARLHEALEVEEASGLNAGDHCD